MKDIFLKVKRLLFREYHTPLDRVRIQIRVSIAIPLIFAFFVFGVSLFYINMFSQVLFVSRFPQGVDFQKLIDYLRIFFIFTLFASLIIGLILSYAIIVPGRKLARLIGISIKGQEMQFKDDYTEFLPQVEKLLSELGERMWEGSKNMAFVIDRDKKILNFNHQAGKFFGLSGIHGEKDLYEIIPSLPENAGFYRILNRGLQKGENFASRVKVLNARGEELGFFINLLPVKKNEGKFLLFLNFVDSDLLEEKIYREELEEKIQMLNRVLTTLTHEVKNPLSVIKGIFSLIREENKLDPKITELLLTEVDKVETLLDDFLLVQRPLKKMLKPSWVDVRDFVRQSIEGIKYAVRDREDIKFQEIYPSQPVLVNCDARLVLRAMAHVIKNAIEAMPDGGVLTVEVKVEEGNVLIDVRDTGRGISQEEMGRIFDPFYTTKEEGTGLGLSLAKQIINAHGGDIQVESEVNRGTRVRIRLSGVKGETNYEHKPEYLSSG